LNKVFIFIIHFFNFSWIRTSCKQKSSTSYVAIRLWCSRCWHRSLVSSL